MTTRTTAPIPMAREDRPQYFQDPAVDRLLQMMLELTAELWAVKDWQNVVLALLEKKGVVSLADVNAYQYSPDEEARVAKQREEFTRNIIQHISGRMEPLKFD